MIKPYNTYILVLPEEDKEEVTSSGIVIAAATAGKTRHVRKGIVKAVNEAQEGKIKIDSTVYFNKAALVDLPYEKELKLVRTEDIYAFEE